MIQKWNVGRRLGFQELLFLENGWPVLLEELEQCLLQGNQSGTVGPAEPWPLEEREVAVDSEKVG